MRHAPLSKEYLIFALISTSFVALMLIVFSYVSFEEILSSNLKTAQKEAKSLELFITESFDYTNQINSHIGQQISKRGAKDLEFILNLFRETDRIKHRNSELFSWSSFDWVDKANRQTVNSRLGIRKDAPDMSARQYVDLSPKNPWTLQLSFPVFGNPSNTWVIPAATGVTDSVGKYLGAIVVGFDIAELTTKIHQRLNQEISFVVLDKDFRIVLKSSDIEIAQDSKFFQQDGLKILDHDGLALNQKISVGSVDLIYSESFSKYPYIALTGFDRAFVRNKFTALVLPRMLEACAVAMFFLLILYIFKTKVFALISIEKDLRLSLERAKEAKDRIFFSISHDIKNYIFGIGGLSKIILESKNKKQILSDEDLQIVETISNQAEELRYFVEDLLDINQVEAGGLTLGELKAINPKQLIETVLTICRELSSRHKVSIATQIEDNLPELVCDQRRMKQIFLNLITNAVKYNRPNGEILITAKQLRSSNQLYIEIADSGFGMSDEEIKKYLSGSGGEISKSEIGKVKEIDSHGIGMPTVLRLLELHRGKIEVESQKGIGTKVKLYFSLHQQRSNAVPTHQATKNKSILIVDDNPVNIKVNSKYLTDAGYHFCCAENGAEALAALDRENFDLILMDGEMPIMDGYEATRSIREGLVFKNFKNYKNIPIIALMSSHSEEVIKKSIESGMNAHIEKTTSKTKLLDMIETFLKPIQTNNT